MNQYLAVLFALILAAQDDPRFQSRSRIVQVPVSVTDQGGQPVDGLSAPDFQVFDNGKLRPATVDTLSTGVAPIALAVAVQSSGISFAVLDKVKKIGAMIRPMIIGERGCAAVLSFAENVQLLRECTNDADEIERAFFQLRTGVAKQGHMLDAANVAIHHLSNQPNFRRVLVIISETKDRGSESNLSDTIAAAQKAGVTIYILTYSAFTTAFTSKAGSGLTGLQDDPTEDPQHKVYRTVDNNIPSPVDPKLKSPANSVDFAATITELIRIHKADTGQALIAGTGGAKLPFLRQKGLESAIEKLGAELHSQYVISFSPEGLDSTASYHNLEVKVKGGAELRVRSRPGYWSEQTNTH